MDRPNARARDLNRVSFILCQLQPFQDLSFGFRFYHIVMNQAYTILYGGNKMKQTEKQNTTKRTARHF